MRYSHDSLERALQLHGSRGLIDSYERPANPRAKWTVRVPFTPEEHFTPDQVYALCVGFGRASIMYRAMIDDLAILAVEHDEHGDVHKLAHDQRVPDAFKAELHRAFAKAGCEVPV